MPKNGVIGEININTRKAADGRHPPFITSVALPTVHHALPEGTILIEGDEAGSAKLAAAEGDQVVIGVLDEAVEANCEIGNVMIHGSCPAEVLVTVSDEGKSTPASKDLISALRGIGIYV